SLAYLTLDFLAVLTLFVVAFSVGLSTAFTNLIPGLDKMVLSDAPVSMTEGFLFWTSSKEESRLEQEEGEQYCILTPPCSYLIFDSLEGCLCLLRLIESLGNPLTQQWEHFLTSSGNSFTLTVEEVYVCQPPGFEDPDHQDKVYKVVKALYASTPIDTKKPLLKDPDGEDVDVHTYRSMISSLMYLTSSRPNIMFASKKQTVFATSSTEAEYVATVSIPTGSDEFPLPEQLPTVYEDRFPLLIQIDATVKKITFLLKTGPRRKVTEVPQPSDPMKHVAYEAVYKEFDDRLVRAVTTASSLEAEQDSGEEVFVQEDVADKEVNVVSEVNADSIATTDSATATMTVDEVTLAQALMDIKSTKPKAKGIVLQEPSESRTTTTTISSKKSQDKCKVIMIEEPVNLKKKDQIMLDEEVALKLQVELQAEFYKEQRLASEKAQQEYKANIALIETEDDV
nr:hypothetical protein [Tanacetum cinerariifolium]